MYLRDTLYLSLLLGSWAICDGLPAFHKEKAENKIDKDNQLAPDEVVRRHVIQFPSMDEMTSAERETNRKMARTIANIIEKNIHMVADDVLQIWSLARTDSVSKDTLEDGLAPLDPLSNDLEDKDDKDFDAMK